MNLPELPQLFLADLPPGLTFAPQMIRDGCFALRQNRAQWLERMRTRQLIEIIAYTAEQWMDPGYSFRVRALTNPQDNLGFPRSTVERSLETFFKTLTLENLEALITQDLGDTRRLDEFTVSAPEAKTSRSGMVKGPELLVHITSGNIPNPALFSMVLGIVTKSAQFIKCARGTSLLPRLFAHSLASTEPKLGACFEIADWPGGSAGLDSALFAEADAVTATGSDETVMTIRNQLPLRCRFVGYGHRLSFGFISKEMLSTYSAKRAIRDCVTDIVSWNQLGCLSPHVFYVQDDGAVSPEGFADGLAIELDAREKIEPRGEIALQESAAITDARLVYELRSSLQTGGLDRSRERSRFFEVPTMVKVWKSEGTTAWTVVYDTDLRFRASCLNRFIYVKPVKQLSEALHYAEPLRHQISTVGLGAVDVRAIELAKELARWGVPRICPIGTMQQPPLPWRHDGRPALGDLVQWTDFES